MPSAVPWDWEAAPSGWVYALDVDYLDASGEQQTARWCGPRTRTGSGLAAAIGESTVRQWESRLGRARHSLTLGGLRQHVQAVASFGVTVDLAGDEQLLRDLRDGRWVGRDIRGYFYDRNTGAWLEMLRGRVRRGLSIGIDRARLRATAGPLLLSEPWPMTRLYRAPLAEAVDEFQIPVSGDADPEINTISHNHVIAVGGAGSYTAPWGGGARDHSWHPSIFSVSAPPYAAYRMIGDHAGKYAGAVWGNGNTALTGVRVWREVVPYGSVDDPVAGWYFFFHVSQQLGCYVHEIAWTDTDVTPNVILEATDSLQAGPDRIVQTFNNHDPDIGPVGSNCRLFHADGLGSGVPEWSGAGSTVRFFARISGPFHNVEDTDEGGSIEVLEVSGSIQYMDHRVIEQVFDDLGLAGELGQGAAAEYGSTTEVGPEAGLDYLRMVCAVPRSIVDRPPSIRDVLGDLFRLGGGDLVQRFETAGPNTDTQRLFPRRRRPSPSYPDADWTLRRGDLVSPDPGAWELEDDPESDYANRVRVESPEYGIGPQDTDGDAADDVLDADAHVSRLHDDAGEQALYGSVEADDEDVKHWVCFPGGEADGYEFMGASRSQRQWWSRVPLGAPRFAVQLTDTVRYEGVPGMLTSVGQVREIEQEWDALHVEVRAVHVTHFEGAGRQSDGPGAGDR